MTVGRAQDGSSDSPVLFLGISEAYLRAFELVWDAEFGSRIRGNWDLALLFHPVSHLLGVSLETAMKGLISCRNRAVPRTHDLKDLLEQAADPDLLAALDTALIGLPVPEDLFEANPDVPAAEIESLYHRHHIHFEMLTRVYDRPFATRYPVLGGHSLPDAAALHRIARTIQTRLRTEMLYWPQGIDAG